MDGQGAGEKVVSLLSAHKIGTLYGLSFSRQKFQALINLTYPSSGGKRCEFPR